MAKRRSRAVGKVAGMLALLAASPALAEKVSLNFVLTPPETNNWLEMTVSATVMFGTRSDTQWTAVSGNALADLDISFDPATLEGSIGTLTFTGGRVAASNTTFVLDWGFLIGKATIKSSGVAGTPSTPVPPGAVTDGSFNAADHQVLFNAGTLSATGTGLIGGLMPTTNINLATDPIAAAGSGIGSLTIGAPVITGSTAAYTVTLQLPVAFDDVVWEDITIGSIRAAASGTIEATGQFTRALPVVWNVDGGGSWGLGSNWTGGVAPDGAGAAAAFLGKLTAANAPGRIRLDGDRTVGTLAFSNANTYIIEPGSGGTLHLNGGDGDAGISVASGSHRITALLAVDDDAAIDVAAGAALELGSTTVAATRRLSKTGPGTARVNGSITAQNDSIISVDAGELAASSISGGQVRIGTGAILTLAHPMGWIQTSTVRSLSIAGAMDAWEGTLDLKRGKLVIQSEAGEAQGVFDTVVDQVRFAHDAGWHGPGITSSAAAGAVGLAVLLDGNDTVIALTWNGDTDLNGVIDADDYLRIDRGLLKGLLGYRNGDFNYDGRVDADDFQLIDQAFLQQNGFMGPGRMSSISVIPEPGMGAIGAALAMLLTRRQRRARG